MKLLSYNVRGVGRWAKRNEVRNLIRMGGMDFCCIQESKLENVNSRIIRSIWGNNKCDWEADLADGNSGGVISIWDKEKFQKVSAWSMKGVVAVNGIWLELGCRCTILNVYAPNVSTLRGELWDQLQLIADQYAEDCMCIIGDFNSIRDVDERRGRGQYEDENDMERFNNFIGDNNLIEVQLTGKRFTWYRPDGTCKSKLDRMLVNSTWCRSWPNQILKDGRRSLSDHIPIFIEESRKDWGPKPFKFFNQWMQHSDFKDFVREKWNSFNIQGWGGFVMKEKLKLLKAELRR